MFCGYCGKQTDAGMKFCPYCGKTMQEETVVVIKTEENATTSEATKSDKAEEARSAFIELLKGIKKAKKLIIAAVVVLVVIIAGVSIVKSQNSVVGTWEYSYGYYNRYNEKHETDEKDGALSLDNYVYKITLYSDGTYETEGFDGWGTRSGTYKIIHDGETIEFSYKRNYYTVTEKYAVDRKGNTLIFGEETPSYYKKTK